MRKILPLLICLCIFNVLFAQTTGTITSSGPLTFCEGGNVVLSLGNIPNGGTIQWQKDGVDITGATNKDFTATLSGSYSAIVKDPNNTTTYTAVVVTVNPNPSASFNSSSTNQCSNIPIQFTNTSTGSGLTYSWDFGDPNSGSSNNKTASINPLHEFIGTTGNSTQSFSVTLKATSASGCVNSISKTISTKQLPDPNLGGTGEGTYDNKSYFKKCTNSASFQFDFTNQSSTTGNNTSYKIIWGDNSPDYSSSSFGATSHTYNVGTSPLLFIVTGQNGCIDTGYYNVFLGTNPAVGLGNPGNTSICTGNSLTFPISGTSSNPPGTTYTVTFNDGTPPITYQHPAPIDITHKFLISSCGTTSGTAPNSYSNSFSASIQASNPCQSSSATVVPIYVSEKTPPSFTIAPKDTVCVNTLVTATNTSAAGFYIDNGTCLPGKAIWKITPATGWTYSGTLGNDFGLKDPSTWQAGSSSLGLTFNTIGTYTIKLITGNPNCGLDSISKTICVNPTPTGSFTLDQNSGCAPLLVKTTSTTNIPLCGINKFVWSVTYSPASGCTPNQGNYSYTSGTNLNSSQPLFQFNDPGIYTIGLTIIAPGSTCSTQLLTQQVTVKTKANVTLSIPSTICQNLTFTPTATANCSINSATTYLWSFPGGIPATSTALNPGSIQLNSSGTNTIQLSVTNECGVTTVLKDIMVNPKPDITGTSNVEVCAGSSIGPLSFNSSITGSTYSWSNSNSAIGLTSGGTGNIIPAFVATNTTSNPVTATITTNALKGGCVGTSSFTIKVNPKPLAPSVVTPVNYCQGDAAQLLNATPTSGNTLNWYSPGGGTSSPSAPLPQTSTAGSFVYNVSQSNTTTGCESPKATITVNVNASPNITTSSKTDPTSCGTSTGSIILNGLTPNKSYSVTYTKNGNPVSVTINSNSSGALIITSLSGGIYDDIKVSSAGCPSNAAGPFTLSDPNPPVTPILGSNSPICSGQALKLTSTTSTTGVSYFWTGPNGYTSSDPNPVINNAGPTQSGTYNLTISLKGCTSSASINVVVNPKPTKPIVSSPITYCQNTQAIALEASGDNLSWYPNSGLTNGSSTPPLPLTGTPGTTTFYVTQKNTFGCESDPASISVIVYPLIGNNVIGTDQTICGGSSAQLLTATSSPTGGNNIFTYQWFISIDNGVTWNSIQGATSGSYNPGVVSQTSKYKRVVTSGGCTDNSNIITITVQGGLSNYEISASQTICSGTTPANLSGQIPMGGDGTYIYQWQNSINGSTWNDISGSNTADFQPPVLTVTTYYRRVVKSGSCSILSSIVTITVNPKPTINTILNSIYCSNSNTNPIVFNSNPNTNVTYAWTNDNVNIGLPLSGSGNIPAFTTTNNSSPKTPVSSVVSVIPTYLNNGVSCIGDATNFTITVLPSVSLDPISDIVVCTGTTVPSLTLANDAGSYPSSSVTYSWVVSGSGIDLLNGTGASIPAFTTKNLSSTDLVATIIVTPKYSYGGKTCDGTPISYTVTTKSATPNASAGPDSILCAESTYTMKATSGPGTSGHWTQIGSNTVSITDPLAPNTTITGLQSPNIYLFEWTVTGFASCPATKDTVKLSVNSPLINQIDNTGQTLCNGQSITIQGITPTGGNGTYQYQWQQSLDGIIWTPIIGQTNSFLTFTPSQSISVRRVVSSLPCLTESKPTTILVQPPVTNNSISSDQSICINTAGTLLKGSNPIGANGTYLYQWQQSIDGGITWNDISNANQQDYDPGILNVTTKFRRNVSSNLCSGPQSNNSNTVTININPNARAFFNPSKDTACAPFTINSSLLQIQPFSDRNGAYLWYANNNLIGSGSTFPGYTINNNGDSIIIKLVTTSQFGCLPDSMEHKFYTYLEPEPAFTLSDTVGCGPLNVLITNTTPNINLFRYTWNFGNGQTSSQDQPGIISFASNPSFGDTIYNVKLSVLSSCQASTVTKQIRVKSKPKALFAPTKTVGCSPMYVLFNNISLGLGNSYEWDFGDGSGSVKTSTADTIGHTFYTAVRDTFYTRLIATNECGSDTLKYAIVVSPNTIKLDFAVNGNQQSGCSPHTVNFINNSKGASVFTWNFGDYSVINTTRNIDTVTHTFVNPGTYIIKLRATNGCSDTTSEETIVVYPVPDSKFSINKLSACLGDSIQFINHSDSATSYLWQFGDGTNSNLESPTHTYSLPGIYPVKLVAFRFNSPGSACTDTAIANIEITSTLKGTILALDTIGFCPPFNINFQNQNLPSLSATWDFGDGTSGSGNNISHEYTQSGNYIVKLTSISPGGCTYLSTKMVNVLGPKGNFEYNSGFLCNGESADFKVASTNTDSIIYNFGDGNYLVSTNTLISHNYINPGIYVPSVTLKNKQGCQVTLPGLDSIKVDKLKAGFSNVLQPNCGFTKVQFKDTSVAFFGISSIEWKFGDGSAGSGSNVFHTYFSSGTYPIEMIVFSNSGCSDTIKTSISILVNSKPKVNVQGDATTCTNYNLKYSSIIQSIDSISIMKWELSNGATAVGKEFNYKFSTPGDYNLKFIAGTVNGCYDTVQYKIHVNRSPIITSTNNGDICRGNNISLFANSNEIVDYSWSPSQGLSCTSCSNPIATPLVTTPYVVSGTNQFGCIGTDTSVVTVIQPLTINVSPNDSICIGASSNLMASGATSYIWSPAIGLNNTRISNPTASPLITTTYRVVGYDGYNCFTDTAYTVVAVGQYPMVNLGPDLTLPTGTLLPLQASIQNGPIKNWAWTPTADLSCPTCPLPVATIKKDISYIVKVTTNYGCSATDTIAIKVFCESAQVYIPNAFTPDNDGVNDVLMVRGSGIVMVKTFRIFNRWGEVVFERSSFPPNSSTYGWDGKIKGIVGGPDVFVYTAEVECENGTTYTYKGNVSIIK